MTMDNDAPEISKTPPANAATYFDGTSSRRRAVTLQFADRLEIVEGEQTLAAWEFLRMVGVAGALSPLAPSLRA